MQICFTSFNLFVSAQCLSRNALKQSCRHRHVMDMMWTCYCECPNSVTSCNDWKNDIGKHGKKSKTSDKGNRLCGVGIKL